MLQIVAVHVQETNLNGTVPCSWAAAGLQSIGLRENDNIAGPLPLCFAAITDEGINVKIDDNSAAAPICGSGSEENVISRQLQKCSNLPGAPTVRPCLPHVPSCHFLRFVPSPAVCLCERSGRALTVR